MVCVGGLLVRDGHVLLGLRSAERAHHSGVWDVPGGHARPAERPEDALVRELREELGVTATRVALLHAAEHDGPAGRYEYRLYAVTGWDGTPENRAPEEHAEIRWCSGGELEGMRLAHPAYLELFRRALAQAGEGEVQRIE